MSWAAFINNSHLYLRMYNFAKGKKKLNGEKEARKKRGGGKFIRGAHPHPPVNIALRHCISSISKEGHLWISLKICAPIGTWKCHFTQFKEIMTGWETNQPTEQTWGSIWKDILPMISKNFEKVFFYEIFRRIKRPLHIIFSVNPSVTTDSLLNAPS